jgi:hypothetical protein
MTFSIALRSTYLLRVTCLRSRMLGVLRILIMENEREGFLAYFELECRHLPAET